VGGVFSFVLEGGSSALEDAVVGASELWLELEINGEPMLPRQQTLSVPYALEAMDATKLGGVGSELYLLEGSNIEVASLTAQGAAVLGGALRVGSSPEWSTCDASVAGAIRFDAVTAVLEFCDGTAWKLLLDQTSQITTLDWSQLQNVPPGFADGIDDDTVIVYSAGLGMLLDQGIFNVDETVFQRRVSAPCPEGQAIGSIFMDGTPSCVPVGSTLVLHAQGGLAYNAQNELGLRTDCQLGETLKFDGSAWQCAPDMAGSGVTHFNQLQGTATDAQIPDNITIGYAQDSDRVDGHHYSPVWDSTDAATLGGLPPSAYAKQADLEGLQQSVNDIVDGTYTPPGVQESICSNSMPTNVCKRDVFIVGQPAKDIYSLAALSGGTWVYNSTLNRCEYQGGVETDAPGTCGSDLMPSWMDTSDACGGFRQSSWDTRVRYAVAKDNRWNKNFEYTCPQGYHWATSSEVEFWFNGPNAGPHTYYEQCGWTGYIWKGKNRYYFRFKDSATNQGVYKHAGNHDPYTLEYSNTVDDFAGIVCVQDAAPGPLDWMITEDDCGGFKQSEHDPRFRFAVSRKTVYDPTTNYQCPAGYHWATTAEGLSAFNTTFNEGHSYYGKCGWNGYDMHNNGLPRYYFLFSDSYNGLTTQAYKHAGSGEMYKVEIGLGALPLGNFAGIVCMADNYVEGPLDWMETSDQCGGFRQSTWDPRFHFAVSKSTTWTPGKTYTCPAGYTWASTADIDQEFSASNSVDQYVYHGQCGWSAYTFKGVTRYFFRLSDSHITGRYMHAGHYDLYRGDVDVNPAYFAGIVCKKVGDPDYPTPATTDWMQTDDNCKGFRESNWDPNVYYAVARQNVWNPAYTYTCPAGFHWATSTEFAQKMGGPNTSYYKYHNQCGWSGYTWHNRYRYHFRFADSSINARYAHAAHGDPYTWDVDATTDQFAGIVCIRNTPDPDPTSWMLKTDNCGGFRQSSWDSQVYFAVSRKDTWVPGQTYNCPTGYTWMSTAQAQQIFNPANANAGASYTYHAQCGWNAYVWQQLTRYYFRFSDSHVTDAYKHAGNFDPYQIEYASTTSEFAGIVCLRNAPAAPTDWMDKTDNCGGFRQSGSDPDVFYAISKTDVWDPLRTYTCPSGYHWASTAEGVARFDESPAYDSHTYYNQCGWQGYDWNPAWQLGCTSYGQAGCGSTADSPTPTFWQVKLDPNGEKYQRGCSECEDFYATACNPPESMNNGGKGACKGIDDPAWYNDQHLGGCYTSPAASGAGFIPGLKPGALTSHCKGGICCGDNNFENVQRSRTYLRFSDSFITGAYKHTGQGDNLNDGTLTSFAGIVCIKD
jgi:hypothetical protein